MEDLFQILFILFFIITSIVSSMRKKKKRQQAKTVPKSQPLKTEATYKKQKSSSEILEEILGIKIEKPEPQPQEVPTFQSSPYTSSYQGGNETWDPTSEYEETSEEGTSTYKEKMEAKKSEITQDKKKHKAFQENKVIHKKKIHPNKFAKLFSKKSDLKKYIIIQEVLNKPKALQR